MCNSVRRSHRQEMMLSKLPPVLTASIEASVFSTKRSLHVKLTRSMCKARVHFVAAHDLVSHIAVLARVSMENVATRQARAGTLVPRRIRRGSVRCFAATAQVVRGLQPEGHLERRKWAIEAFQGAQWVVARQAARNFPAANLPGAAYQVGAHCPGHPQEDDQIASRGQEARRGRSVAGTQRRRGFS